MWETKFARRQKKFYHTQDKTVVDELREDGTFNISIPERRRVNLQELRSASLLTNAFLRPGRTGNLDPPALFSFGILRDYLTSADVTTLWKKANDPEVIFLDDRCDPTVGPSASRVWNCDEYLNTPPRGENVFVGALELPNFVLRLRRKVRFRLVPPQSFYSLVSNL